MVVAPAPRSCCRWTSLPEGLDQVAPGTSSSLDGAVGVSAHSCLSRAEDSWVQGGDMGLAPPQRVQWSRAVAPGMPSSCVMPVSSNQLLVKP